MFLFKSIVCSTYFIALCAKQFTLVSMKAEQSFVAGADGCRGGWVFFAVNGVSRTTKAPYSDTFVRVERELAQILRARPKALVSLAIDIPIGLVERSRECDLKARELLGKPRSNSVFPAPCRAALSAASYTEGSEINLSKTDKRLTLQAWGIVPKIKEIDDALPGTTPDWVFEVHPELCFWAMNHRTPMRHGKKRPAGRLERVNLLVQYFPRIEDHLAARDSGVSADDLLDGAAAAWTALRHYQGSSQSVGANDPDTRGLPMKIHF
jgi:predicted RNase H-like nuclease